MNESNVSIQLQHHVDVYWVVTDAVERVVHRPVYVAAFTLVHGDVDASTHIALDEEIS